MGAPFPFQSCHLLPLYWVQDPYISQTGDQQRFTISEVAANWHKLIMSIMRPSIARSSNNGSRGAAHGHTTVPIYNTSRKLTKLLLISRPAESRRLS